MRMMIDKTLIRIVALLACSMAASLQAMEIREFDKMTDDDQGEYIVKLIDASILSLQSERKIEMSDNLYNLFIVDRAPEGATQGMSQFYKNLETARKLDIKNGQKPNDCMSSMP